MGRITLDELRGDLEGCISRVRRGERLLVVDEEAEVMSLQPRSGEATTLEADLRDLEHEGVIRRPAGPAVIDPPRLDDLPKPTDSVLEALLEERRTGR